MSDALKAAMEEAVRLRTGEAFEIIYHGGSSPGSTRTLMPLKVDSYTVYAKCLDSNSEKTFRFDRMEPIGSNDARRWSSHNDTSPKTENISTKKKGLFSSLKKTENTPMTKKQILSGALLLGFIGFLIFGLPGFAILFLLSLYSGYSHNKGIKKKAETTPVQKQDIVFAPVSKSQKSPVQHTTTKQTESSLKSPPSSWLSTPTTKTEARQMVKQLTTKEEVEDFIQSCEKAQDELYDNHFDKSEKQLDRISDALLDAVDLASEKIIQYQFIPDIGVSTPIAILELAYQTYSPDQFKKLNKTLPQEYKQCWEELMYDEEPELEHEFLEQLKMFQKQVSSANSDEELVDRIDSFLRDNPIFMEEFFGEEPLEDDLTYGQQLIVNRLTALGLPMAYDLYSEGYTTISKCLEIDPEEFIKRKGVGPKKKQQLIEFQKNQSVH